MYNTHKILTSYLSKFLCKEGEYRVLYPNMAITKEMIVTAVRKYYRDNSMSVLTIYNPDLKEEQSLDDFTEYIKKNGLSAWDTGENDL